MSTLQAKNLYKKYKTRQVVKDVSFDVKSGEIVGLFGPNGAGKTTSFYITVGLIKADDGKILLDKQNITSLPMHKRAQLGISYLPQEPSVFRKLSVADNIMAILELRPGLEPEYRKEALEDLLQEFNLNQVRDTLGISLSGGERRRVEIARALAMEPKFILLDEPFAGIDPLSVNDLKALIEKLSRKNIGILITDHSVRAALNICHRAYIINEGKVLSEGTPREISHDPKVREVYLGHDFSL